MTGTIRSFAIALGVAFALAAPHDLFAQTPAAQPPASTQPPPATVQNPTAPTPPQTQQQVPLTSAQQTPALQPASPGSNVDADGAAALLDRMEVILNATLNNKPVPSGDKSVGTSGVMPGVDSKSSAGRITFDRSAMDELLAEVQQLRSMLRVTSPK